MIVIESKISKKYALAFLNVHGETCTSECISKFSDFCNFIASNKLFQATLDIPSLPFETKKLIINYAAQKLNLPDSAVKLTLLLLKDKRISLIGEVFKKIIFIYKKKEKRHHFNVTTSHKLTPQEEISVTSFIKKNVPNNITASFNVDTSLISGIRIEGNTFLWERSIAKQLRSIEQKILCQEKLW